MLKDNEVIYKFKKYYFKDNLIYLDNKIVFECKDLISSFVIIEDEYYYATKDFIYKNKQIISNNVGKVGVINNKLVIQYKDYIIYKDNKINCNCYFYISDILLISYKNIVTVNIECINKVFKIVFPDKLNKIVCDRMFTKIYAISDNILFIYNFNEIKEIKFDNFIENIEINNYGIYLKSKFLYEIINSVTKLIKF